MTSPIHPTLPFFYIMLPTFNRPELVIRSVESVISQSYLNYKLVIFNDGSTKDYSKLELMIKNKERIHYIKSKNIGINRSRNIMLNSFLKEHQSDDNYFFTLSDDDYLIHENALKMIADGIKRKKSIWYCFNCKSNSQDIFQNSDYLNYEKITYSDFTKKYKGDKHFVFKLNSFKQIKYPEKYFKNGFEHLFYYKIPSKIQTIPSTVKVIQYYDDGLSISNRYDGKSHLEIMVKELKSAPFIFLFYKKLFLFLIKPKNIIKIIISDEKYYRIKKKIGLKSKKQ